MAMGAMDSAAAAVTGLSGGVPALLCVAYVGLKILGKAVHVLRYVHAHFLQTPLQLAPRYAQSGAAEKSYVLVTGATSFGIGYAYAEEWAKQGFNIALLGRDAEKLAKCAVALKKVKDVDVKLIEVADQDDVCAKKSTCVSTVMSALEKVDVAAVVHAAGESEMAFQLTDSPSEKIRKVLSLNAGLAVLLTHALLPRFEERVKAKTAKRSAVVIVGGGIGLRPAPHVNIYSSTKSCLSFFGQALSVEYEDTTDVLVTHPLGVTTNLMPHHPVDNLEWITPAQCAKACMKQLGHSWAQNSWTNGTAFHEFQWGIVSNMPMFVFRRLLKFMVGKELEATAKLEASKKGKPQ